MLTLLGERPSRTKGVEGRELGVNKSVDAAMATRFERRKTNPLGCTLKELAIAVNGDLLQGDPKRPVGPLATDSRHVDPGDAFLAIKGRHFDGSDFLGDAIEKGAEVVITSAPQKLGDQIKHVAIIKVDDAQQALLNLERWHRNRLGIKTICITGSCGKTSTKELVSSIYENCFDVISTYKNFNNLVGVPITLLNAHKGHQWAVLELGTNSPGEIGQLARASQPDIALITNICPAHLEGLGSIDGVAQEKLSLLSSMSSEKTAVVNLDDPNIMSFIDFIPCKKVGFSLEGHTHEGVDQLLRLISWRPLGYGIDFEVEINGVKEAFFCGVPGLGNLQNLMAAIAVATAGGIPTGIIKGAISTVKATPGRLYFRRIGSWMVIDDTYNANPASMKNALSTLAFWSDALFRCAILGDMFELGPNASQFHYEIGRFAASTGLSMLLAAGRYAPVVKDGAIELGMGNDRVLTFDNTDSLCIWLRCHARDVFPEDAWILLKGSRGMKMEKAVQAIMG